MCTHCKNLDHQPDPLDFSDLESSPEQLQADSVSPDNDQRKRYPCPRCGGTGHYQGIRIHQEKEQCFACNGRGYFLTSPDQRAKNRNNAARRKAKKAEAAREAALSHINSEARGLLEWLEANVSWNNFAVSLVDQLANGRKLSENQISAAQRMQAKTEASRAARDKERNANAKQIDLSRINELFASAMASGIARPILRLDDIRLNQAAAHSKNPGHLYVKLSGSYVGKIDPHGRFFPIRGNESVGDHLAELAKDPMAALSAHGRKTGQCACCGRTLTNKDSIELGIGPICASNWGL